MIVTNNDIIIKPNGIWTFHGKQIDNPNVLDYFKRNLFRDNTGYYIINKFGKKKEKGILKAVHFFPINVTSLQLEKKDNAFKYFFTLDFGETIESIPENLFFFNEETIALLLNNDQDHPLFARLNAIAMTSMIDVLSLDDQNNYLLQTSKPGLKVKMPQAKLPSLIFIR